MSQSEPTVSKGFLGFEDFHSSLQCRMCDVKQTRVVLNRWSFWVYVSGIKSRLLQITESSLMSFNFLKNSLSGRRCGNLNLAVWTQGTLEPTDTRTQRVCRDWTQRQTGRGTERKLERQTGSENREAGNYWDRQTECQTDRLIYTHTHRLTDRLINGQTG